MAGDDVGDLYLSQAEEDKTEALARFAAGIIHEMNEEPEPALEQFYLAALADLDNETLTTEVARQLLVNKQPERALELLEKTAKRPEVSGNVYAWLGVARFQLGQTDSAIAANRTAIEKLPRLLPAYHNLCRIYIENNQGPLALDVLDLAAKQAELDAEGWLDLAQYYASYRALLKAEPEAIQRRIADALNHAEKLHPTDLDALEKLADGYRQLGNQERAAQILLEIVAKEPERAGVRQKLIDALLRANDRSRAREQLEALARERPTNPMPHLYLGLLAREEKDYARAESHVQTAVTLSPGTEALYFELAETQLNARKPRAALATLERARKRFPSSFPLELYTGLAHSALRAYALAIKYYTAAEVLAQATDPTRLNAVFYFHTATASERLRDFEAADKYFARCLELAPKFAEALNYCGYMWTERGIHLDQARSMIQQALEIEPDNAAYLDSLGWVLFKLNQPSEALPHILKALEKSEEPDATISEHLGDIYHALGNAPKARQAWETGLATLRTEMQKKSETDAPADPAALAQLGDLLAKLGRPAEARQAWGEALELDPNEAVRKKLDALDAKPLQ